MHYFIVNNLSILYIPSNKKMSEDPRKRQKIEEIEKNSVGEYHQDSLKYQLEDKRLEIAGLKKENQQLLEENNKMHLHISKFTSG